MADALHEPSETQAPTPAEIAQPLMDVLMARLESSRRSVVVAIDGRSGSGKSALGAALAEASEHLNVTVTVIEGDGFYAGGSAQWWDQRSAADKAYSVIDWRRQRQVLEDLRLRGYATWYPFDWESPDWDSDPVPLRTTPASATAADIVILEGAYSARPQLHDVIDIRVLLDTPPGRRRRQLLERDGDEYRSDWEGRWSAAEDWYFGTIMTPDLFDHVL